MAETGIDRSFARAGFVLILLALVAVPRLAAQGSPSPPTPTYRYDAPDSTFSVRFPLPASAVRSISPIAGGYVLLMGDDGETQFGVAVFDNAKHLGGPASVIIANTTSARGQGFALGAVEKDSAVRLGFYGGYAGRIEGENSDRTQHRVQLYRVVLVGKRLFHVWATTLHGRALSDQAPAFLESFVLRCNPRRECGAANAPVSSTLTPVENQTYFAFQVQTPVRLAPGSAVPRFPDSLREAHLTGDVVAQFVVDTTGLVDRETFKVLKSTHQLFTNAVVDVLPELRFIPAELGGRKVRQLVEEPFHFELPKAPDD
jgi:hypothetical protein